MSQPVVMHEPGARPELFERPSIFLSASDPYRKRWEEVRRPERVRSAVCELCRFAFGWDLNLVFGGHPAISPLVLSAARHFVQKPRRRKRVIVFQSHFFHDVIPRETIELADWENGEILWTAARPGPPARRARDKSLTWMREVMVRSPGLRAAVFIGGMEGALEEAELFRRYQEGRPLYAIGSTGGAAERLLAGGGCQGGLPDGNVLAENVSYPWVCKTLFEDLGL